MKKTHNPIFALTRNEAELNLYLYEEIEGDATDFWSGEVIESATSAKTIAKAIEDAGDVTAINVYINSYGGDVKEGLGIYAQLQRHPATVTAYIDGFACSIASVIAMAADKVVMNPSSLMMIHRAWMVTAGNAEELRKAADDLEVIDGTIRTAYLNKAGDKLTETELTNLLSAETWLSAEKCQAYGLCDEVKAKEEPAIEEEVEEAIEDAKNEAIGIALRDKLTAMFNTNLEK